MVKSVTSFDDLPNEIIVYIFKYLSVADQYDSLFNMNTRLRRLVKQWGSYSRAALDHDVTRFCKLHSWYKLSLAEGGRLCFLYPRRGEQSRINDLDEDGDTKNLHWWISYSGEEPIIDDERVRTIIVQHPFRLTPFCYGCRVPIDVDSNQRAYSYEGIIVHNDRGKHLESWLQKHYPEYAGRLLQTTSTSTSTGLYTPIVKAEWAKLWRTIHTTADQIWSELRNLENVNPLMICADH